MPSPEEILVNRARHPFRDIQTDTGDKQEIKILNNSIELVSGILLPVCY